MEQKKKSVFLYSFVLIMEWSNNTSQFYSLGFACEIMKHLSGICTHCLKGWHCAVLSSLKMKQGLSGLPWLLTPLQLWQKRKKKNWILFLQIDPLQVRMVPCDFPLSSLRSSCCECPVSSSLAYFLSLSLLGHVSSVQSDLHTAARSSATLSTKMQFPSGPPYWRASSHT